MSVVGIDVGKTGAFAIVDPDGVAVCTHQRVLGKQIDVTWMRLALTGNSITHVFIESVRVFPKSVTLRQSPFAISKLSIHFGIWCGLCAALEIPYTPVPVNVWKRDMGVTSDKKTSIAMAQRLFPNVSLLPTERCTKKSDGMAEALLIGEYGLRVLGPGR